MSKSKRYEKTGGYIVHLQKNVYAGILHNKALKKENLSIRKTLEGQVHIGEPLSVQDMKDILSQLEPDWDKHWKDTFGSLKNIPPDDFRKMVQEAKANAKS